MKIEAAGLTDVGRVQEINEDWIYHQLVQDLRGEPVGLFFVADGMGGYLGEELASQWVVKTIQVALADLFAMLKDPSSTVRFSSSEIASSLRDEEPGVKLEETESTEDFKIRSRLVNALQQANTVAWNIAPYKPGEAVATGSTATVALIWGDKVHIAHVGDTRAYLLRAGKLTQLTTDHSVAASLLMAGQIKAEELCTHPQRKLLYRYLGDEPEVEVDTIVVEIEAGDKFLLCSDGLWAMVHAPQLAAILAEGRGIEETCCRLVQAAKDGGGEDNIAVIVIQAEAWGAK
jgi:serine/threonine protein phosphatase PrpC